MHLCLSRRWLVVGLAAVALGWCDYVAAQTNSAVDAATSVEPAGSHVAQVQIGFDGKYKAGYWAPVWLSLKPDSSLAEGRLDLVATDGDNVPVVYPAEGNEAVSLAAAAGRTYLRYARIGPQRGRLAARLGNAAGDRFAWSESLTRQVPQPLAATQELFVTIGPELGVAEALKLTRRSEELAAVAARVDAVELLPDRWWGYEGVDWVFLSTRSEDLAEKLSPAQFEALRQWVLLGGRLALCVGSNGEQILGEGSRWRPLAPGKFEEVRPLRDRAGFESFANAELPWDDEAFQRSRPLVTQFSDLAEGIELDEGGNASGRPLAIRRPYGLGHVLFLTFDLDDPHIAAWSGRPRLVNNLIQRWQRADEDTTRTTGHSVQHLGFEDLSGQLRSALEQFPGVTVISFTTVSVLTLLYLLLIGPADFLFFRRLGLPAQGTWITFPLVVAIFCGIAWYIGQSAHGTRVRLNQAEVVDFDAVEGVVRGTTWHHLYSPTSERFDLTLNMQGSQAKLNGPPQGWLGWQGLPGSGLGGLASQQVSLAELQPYTVNPPGERPAVFSLPVQVASSKALAGRWWGRADLQLPSTLTTNEFGLPQGAVHNPFPVDLDECLLAYDEWLYRLGTIQAGQSVALEDLSPLNLEARLTQRTVSDAKDITTPWDQSSGDVARIVQIMMFHDVARGRGYTGLTHRYQSQLDLTEQIRGGRAIFVGRSETSVASLSLIEGDSPAAADDTRSYTWLRIVLPVDKRGDRR